MKKNNFKEILKGGIIIFFILFSILYYNGTFSSINDNISGFGWGAEKIGTAEAGGMGTLSFNCTNNNSCEQEGSRNYGLHINQNNEVVGFAWSKHYGWLKFGGLSGFPSGGIDTESSNAKFVGTFSDGKYNGHIEGWARFCTPTTNALDCGEFSSNNLNGGWDGWVSLKGNSTNNNPYGVVINDNNFSGYAWGGDDERENFVGWIKFEGVIITPISTDVLAFWASPNPTVEATPTTTKLYWNALDGLGFTSCNATSATPGNSTWTGVQTHPTTDETIEKEVNVNNNPTVYEITCLRGTNTYTKSVSVSINKINENIALNCTKISPEFTTNIVWEVVGDFDTCTGERIFGNGEDDWSGDKDVAGGQDLVTIGEGDSQTIYKLTCETPDGREFVKQLSINRADTSKQCSSSTLIKKPIYIEN